MSPLRRQKHRAKLHQLVAARKVLATFKKYDRCQLVMACGTGKTLVALLVAERGRHKTVVVFVPSLALVRQILASWTADASWGKWDAIAVCSDPTVAADATYVAPEDVGCEVTTDRERVGQFVARAGVRVVFCTYQSAEVLARMQFEFGVFDEAHKTAGRQGKSFAFALSDENVQISKRLFMTATPRHVRVVNDQGDEEPIFSMRDESVYGPVAHELGFREAIEQGHICDYKIVIGALLDEVDTNSEAAAQVALAKVMQNFGCDRAITFHSSIARAERFSADKHGALSSRIKWHVNGSMHTDERDRRLLEMSQLGGIVTNVRCLSEGVDFPDVDMVAFVDPKRSPIDIVQAVGRCLRIDPQRPQKNRGIVFVPVYVRPGEDDTAAVMASSFDHVYDVLQALKEGDEILAEELRSLSSDTTHGRADDRDRESIIEVTGDGKSAISVEGLERAIWVRLARAFHTADANKKALLNLPPGSPRPSRLTRLSGALKNYTNKSQDCYDPDFDRAIRAKQPQWWVDSAAVNKQALLDLPPGSPRPSAKTKLGGPLCTYTNKNKQDSYDPDFDCTIRAKQPQWWVDSAAVNKQALLDLPPGSPRPTQNTRLGVALTDYTCSRRHRHLDFDRAIRAKQPQWWPSTANKQALLDLSPGSPRPSARTRLGGALSGYTCKSNGSYDPDFDCAIRAKQPQWWLSVSAAKKKMLLDLPPGSPRPAGGSELRQALYRYLNKNQNYDADFDRAIRVKQPQWWFSVSAAKKRALLDLPPGSPRPARRSELGAALHTYTVKSSGSYDPDFDRTVRTKQPHWLRPRK